MAIRSVQGGERDGERIPDQGPAHGRVVSSPALLGNCSEIAESDSPETPARTVFIHQTYWKFSTSIFFLYQSHPPCPCWYRGSELGGLFSVNGL